jgi:WhiB family redox-sensing transcriptional regulator
VKTDLSWHDQGVCAEPRLSKRADELWFSPYAQGRAEAIKACAACPIRLRCLEGALERREAAGVWGGHDFDPKGATDKSDRVTQAA